MISPERHEHRRINFVLIAMSLVALALAGQLIRVQFGPYAPVFSERLDTPAIRDRVSPSRGMIYDRDGRLLATNATQYHLEVEVRQMEESSPADIAAVVSKLLGLPYEDLTVQLDPDLLEEDQLRIRLTRKDANGQPLPILVDQGTADILRGFMDEPEIVDLSGLSLAPNPKRIYPAGALAGHILGFVNQENKGYFGVEGYYDEWLAGKPITVERPLIPPEAKLQPNPPAGVNLVLTIDIDIQQVLDEVLKEAMTRSRAESGQIVVMDPRNGEILGMAAWPALDPGNYEPWLKRQEGSQSVITPFVAGQYEPGSTFKVLTMAAAIDAEVVKPEDPFLDTGKIEVGGHIIRNWDEGVWGPQTMVGCLQHSLNVCLAYVASERLGASLFYEYLRQFGIGQMTGADLAGEVPGQLRTPRHPDWTASDLGTNSFGQGVSVTPVQLITAVGALANGGVVMQPHIVRQVVSPQGVYWPKPTVLGRVIGPEAAATVTQMLTQSLAGETKYSEVPGYELAGKTGTAQIPTGLGYDPRWTIASFVGWGPVSDPHFVVLVRFDRPRTSRWGSEVAAPVFQKVVERLVVLMDIPPDDVREQLARGAEQEQGEQ